ncbi:putative bifunctional diguanylate cyclase/phosphodiesterase [Halorhodospira neutriphila]|uniref:Diguanylate cyclase/phosphodiesterase with PAS/PAC sensor(S) n=1 Tax=Halorhodospira neutriphila TaxID=168379 RepID=A0ABS1E7Q5_9GAMM|nr:EAL domain-containing protein [Halorhodospira neutriphila]MBK1726309.1 hypothetical protein [Halorhodospira neutriphila]
MVSHEGSRGAAEGGSSGPVRSRQELLAWNTALDAVHSPTFIHDTDYRIVAANSAYCELAGFPLTALEGLPYWEAFPLRDGPLPACRGALEARQQQGCLLDETLITIEEIVLADGETFLSRSFSLEPTEPGSHFVHVLERIVPTGTAVGSAADADEPSLPPHGRDGVILTDEAGRIAFCNPRSESLLGQQFARLRGQELSAFLLPEPAGETAPQREASGSQEAMLFHTEGYLIPIELVCKEILLGARRYRHYALYDLGERCLERTPLNELLHWDPVTELPNRLLLHKRLEQALTAAEYRASPLAVLSLGIEAPGAAACDEATSALEEGLIGQIGAHLRSALRGRDTIARLGLRELGVLAPRLRTPDDAARVAERLLAELATPFTVGGCTVPITVHVGLSVYPDQSIAAADLVQQASAAMGEARQRGAPYHFASKGLTERAQARIQLAAELRQAFAEEQLTVHYQPQIDLGSGGWIGYEALLRWPHPERGWISPGQFMPMVERTGLIVHLGDWVLEQACHQAQRRLEGGEPLDRMAVNLAAPQLLSADFVEKVLAILERSGLPARYLELEITEGLLVAPDDATVEKLQALRRAGVRIAIDDFGTGYSALSYLKDLPVDRLKVDRSFVSSLCRDPRASTIVRSIVGLAGKLGFAVIAEGIETEAQRSALVEAGCRQGQGFLFAYPSAAPEPPP